MFPVAVMAAAVVGLAPGCHHAVLQNNSGEGSNWPIVICDSDDRLLIVDGGPIGPNAVILGFGKENPS
jgi:hypothetical protein